MTAHTSAAQTYNILIVDDNEGIHHDFRSLLGNRSQPDQLDDLAQELFGDEAARRASVDFPSYRFDSVFQGQDALDSVQQGSESGVHYALAFVDVRMPPGWDGIETIRRLWQVDPDIHMVVCTAYTDYAWEDIIEGLGVTDKLQFLRKPVDPNSVKQIALSSTRKWSREQGCRESAAALQATLHELSATELDDRQAALVDRARRSERQLRAVLEQRPDAS